MNHIKEYHNQIQEGKLVAGELVKQVYEKLANGLDNGEYFFDANRASIAVEFIESFCHHSKGQAGLIKLELWQKAAVSAIFGIVDKDGLRQFREVFIMVGRKNGKSLLAAAIMGVMAYADDEYGAELYCLATKLAQAKIVLDNFHQMIQREDELSAITKKRRDDIYIPDSNTSVQALAFSEKKSDGLNPHFVVNDEVASWPGASGLRQYEVMRSAMGARREPLILNISTAGYESGGIFDELYTRATRFLQGGEDERRLLPILYAIDSTDEWDDIHELKKANPNLGISVFESYLRDQADIARGSPAAKAEFMTKFCNIKQNAIAAWLPAHLVERAGLMGEGLTLADFENSYAVGGIDLSQTTDLTAASCIIQRNGRLYAFTQFFMPKNRLVTAQEEDNIPYNAFVQQGILTLSGENFVDYKDVYNWFRFLSDECKIFFLKIGYDRYSSQYLIDDLNSDGYHTDYVKQGEKLTPVIREFEGILKDGGFAIANNKLCEYHFLDVALKQNLETREVKPTKIDSRSRIDGAVSVLCAMTVRQKYWKEVGALLENEDDND